jgi:hypothetical protein
MRSLPLQPLVDSENIPGGCDRMVVGFIISHSQYDTSDNVCLTFTTAVYLYINEN